MRRSTPGNAEPQLGAGISGCAELGLGVPRGSSQPPGMWHSRGYLPHFDSPVVIQSITFRLADSLPREELGQLERELSALPEDKQDTARRRRIEQWLDTGSGCCALRQPQLAAIMQETLLKWDGDRYRLLAWCIMPNHVHALIEPQMALAKIVQSWKAYTGRWAFTQNRALELGIPGPGFWMREYWDRYIRDGGHFANAVEYIHRNPVQAGLCQRAEEWPWSSAAAIPSEGMAASVSFAPR